MEMWVPLAILSVSFVVLWVSKRCTEDEPSASEPNDFNVLRANCDSYPQASTRWRGEREAIPEGPPEAWMRMFTDSKEPKPKSTLRLVS